MIYITDRDITSDVEDNILDAVLIPTASSYSHIKEYKTPEKQMSAIPTDLLWVIKTYLSKESDEDIIQTATMLGSATASNFWNKNLTENFGRTWAHTSVKPVKPEVLVKLPNLFGVTICTDFRCILRDYKDHNFAVMSDTPGKFQIAIMDAIAAIFKDTYYDLKDTSLCTIGISPLFDDLGYLPPGYNKGIANSLLYGNIMARMISQYAFPGDIIIYT